MQIRPKGHRRLGLPEAGARGGAGSGHSLSSAPGGVLGRLGEAWPDRPGVSPHRERSTRYGRAVGERIYTVNYQVNVGSQCRWNTLRRAPTRTRARTAVSLRRRPTQRHPNTDTRTLRAQLLT